MQFGREDCAKTLSHICHNCYLNLLILHPLSVSPMDASFFDRSYLDEMFLFKNKENIFVENTDAQSDEESPDVEGFLSSDDKEELSSIPIHIEHTCLRKERLRDNETDMASETSLTAFISVFVSQMSPCDKSGSLHSLSYQIAPDVIGYISLIKLNRFFCLRL